MRGHLFQSKRSCSNNLRQFPALQTATVIAEMSATIEQQKATIEQQKAALKQWETRAAEWDDEKAHYEAEIACLSNKGAQSRERASPSKAKKRSRAVSTTKAQAKSPRAQ